MEKLFRLGTVKTVSASEIEVVVHFPSGGLGEMKQEFKLQQQVRSGTSPKEFIAMLSHDLAERIYEIPEWPKDIKMAHSIVIGLQYELESRLLASEDFRNNFNEQFERIILIKNFNFDKSSVIVTYSEVSPLELQRMANNPKDIEDLQPITVNTVSCPLSNYKGSEAFMLQFTKLLGKSVDNIWIIDRLNLKNAVMSYMYNRKRKREKVLVFICSFLLLCLFAYGITKYDYTSIIEYSTGKTDIETLEDRLLCFRVALEKHQQNNSIEAAVFYDLGNIDLLLKGFSQKTSEENIQFLKAEIENFKEKINKHGIDLNYCQ